MLYFQFVLSRLQDSEIVAGAEALAVVEEEDVAAVTVEDGVASEEAVAEVSVVAAVDEASEDVVEAGADPLAVEDEVVVVAEPRLSSLSHIVTRECLSHVERRTRLSPVIWYLDRKCTARRGSLLM